MRIRFLGTGAATAAPLPFCRCDFCRELREKRIFRSRAALLINDEIIIDFGPDVPRMAADTNTDLTRVHTVLQTHSHADHFDAGHFVTRIPGYAPENLPELTLLGSPVTVEHLREKMMREEGDDADILSESACESMRMLVRGIEPGRAAHLCRYDVLPIAVPHDVRDGSVIYVVTDLNEDKSLLYATDCPAFTDEVWAALAPLKLDCAIMDHTYGSLRTAPGGSHMHAGEFAAVLRRLRETGILKPGAPAFATHISHESHGSVAQMETFAAAHGYSLPNDGDCFEI